jgi:hypothetical protein
MANRPRLSSVALRRHFHADVAFQSHEWQRLSADALSRHGQYRWRRIDFSTVLWRGAHTSLVHLWRDMGVPRSRHASFQCEQQGATFPSLLTHATLLEKERDDRENRIEGERRGVKFGGSVCNNLPSICARSSAG